MAMQLPEISTDFGVTLANAYVKVLRVDMTKTTAVALLGAFPDKSTADGGTPPIKQWRVDFTPDLTTGNAIQQAYDAAKGLPEFAGETDILDEETPQ